MFTIICGGEFLVIFIIFSILCVFFKNKHLFLCKYQQDIINAIHYTVLAFCLPSI